jgi:glyoxylate carboligase
MIMARMRAIEAAVEVMLKEGVTAAFGLPGAAINPLYAAMRKIAGIDHVLARHVEGASHMAEGYTRAKAGNIGVCIGTADGGYRHNHRLVLGGSGFDSNSLHHWTGAAHGAVQGRFSDGGHRIHRQAGHQVGGHRS